MPPRKGRQPLLHFGAEVRGSGLTHLDKLGLDLYAAMMGVKNPYRQRGGNLMKELMMASQPKTARRQRGAGLLSIFTRPLLRLFGKKVTKQAAKAVAR